MSNYHAEDSSAKSATAGMHQSDKRRRQLVSIFKIWKPPRQPDRGYCGLEQDEWIRIIHATNEHGTVVAQQLALATGHENSMSTSIDIAATEGSPQKLILTVSHPTISGRSQGYVHPSRNVMVDAYLKSGAISKRTE
ncbi:hypothetical protein CLCR_06387 [Cladophialophora carrionii]|uniref:Uncharacterized protein n=1 Tax=Cladophialophora carrionii TaxID=86049 RepID=A0A1C1C922_9EURO|nr:hypothetical protein CLCR_06387 [Cladophialophora carrionii]